ncbi:MAG TPA: hypothetical protein PKW51_09715, partial [Methanoregulaceae archaeon]|nr:hypothetical protein [Methanoregulaceae archaeon]
ARGGPLPGDEDPYFLPAHTAMPYPSASHFVSWKKLTGVAGRTGLRISGLSRSPFSPAKGRPARSGKPGR